MIELVELFELEEWGVGVTSLQDGVSLFRAVVCSLPKPPPALVFAQACALTRMKGADRADQAVDVQHGNVSQACSVSMYDRVRYFLLRNTRHAIWFRAVMVSFDDHDGGPWEHGSPCPDSMVAITIIHIHVARVGVHQDHCARSYSTMLHNVAQCHRGLRHAGRRTPAHGCVR